jgi:hypothetical protein
VALEPATFEMDGLFALSVKASASRVSRDLFAADMVKALEAGALVEAGAIEVTLRDLGLVDLLGADLARRAGQPPEAGRAMLLQLWAQSAQMREADPATASWFEATGRFLQGKGQTLTVRLTPKGRVRALDLVEALRLDPFGAVLAGFTLEASSTP